MPKTATINNDDANKNSAQIFVSSFKVSAAYPKINGQLRIAGISCSCVSATDANLSAGSLARHLCRTESNTLTSSSSPSFS